jgi:hypothetical protein
MNSSSLRLRAGNRWRQSMTAYTDYFVRMCWARNQAGFTCSFISLEGLAIVVCRRLQKEQVFGAASPWRKLSQVELWADGWHTEPRSSRQLALMKWISTPTISLEKIRSKGSEAVAAAIGVPG